MAGATLSRYWRDEGQRGFTLIEMLAVISILGVMAGLVSMSMVGVTELAQRRAAQAELMTVQSAMNAMIMDQSLDPDDACSLYNDGAVGTVDMAAFPSALPWVSQGGSAPPGERPWPVQLFPHYLRKRTVSRRYVCTGGGTVIPAG